MNVRRIPDNSYYVPIIIRVIPQGMYPTLNTVSFTVCLLVFRYPAGWYGHNKRFFHRDKWDLPITQTKQTIYFILVKVPGQSLFRIGRGTFFGLFRYRSGTQCSYLLSHSLEQRHVLLNGKLQGTLG